MLFCIVYSCRGSYIKISHILNDVPVFFVSFPVGPEMGGGGCAVVQGPPAVH